MLFIVATLLLVLTWVARAQVVSAPDYKIKAGFIYNFAKLTQWPTNAFKADSSPIEIGVVGADSLADYLDIEIRGRAIDGRMLRVSRSKPDLLVTNCHILFISASVSEHVDQLPSAIRNRAILTIGESQKFISAGGIIRLVRKGDALQFEVGRVAAHNAGLTFSSKLLALAKIPKEERRP